MSKENKFSRRDFLRALPIGLAAFGVAACSRSNIPLSDVMASQTPEVTPKPSETAHPVQIPESLQNESVTAEPTPVEPTSTPEVHSKEPFLGPIYMGLPFQIEVPVEVASLGGFGSRRIEDIKEPLVVNEQDLTPYQIGILKDYGNHPNAAIVARTDDYKAPNHWLIAGHSGFNFGYLPFDVFRRMYLKNPDEIVGQSIYINQGNKRVEIEFVNATHVTAEEFGNAFVSYDNGTPAFYWLEKLGIPYLDENVDLVTFAACLNTLPGDVKRDENGNPILDALGRFVGAPFSITYNRVLLTAKFVKEEKIK